MLRAFGVLGLVVVCFSANAAPPAAPTAAPVEKGQLFDGKVVPLADALKKLGVKPDADTTGVALVTADGTVYTIVKDATSRLLFMDKQLHGRDFRLTAKLLPGTHALHVEKVQTVKNGKIFNVDYWCDQCQLEASEPGPCKCCGGDTVLRELPAK
jgi:hypothetical protein